MFGVAWVQRVLLCAAVLAGMPAAAFDVKVEEGVPEYQKADSVSGKITSVGSDTLNNMMTFWNEAFRAYYPNIEISIEGKGSSTAPPALIAGTSQLGPMSRRMKSTEIDLFEEKYGFEPVFIRVALDSLAVFVNKDNPIEKLSFEEVDALFSKTRNSGYPQEIETWGELGLGGTFANLPISLYGRNAASGTYAFFKENALFKGDFKNEVKEQPGSASVVMGISEDKAGIGYSGIGYQTSGVRAVPLAENQGEPAYEPSYENVLEGKYPLSRALYVYIVKKPGQPVSPIVEEFIRFALSKEGQEIVIKDGYLPLPAAVIEQELAKLEG